MRDFVAHHAASLRQRATAAKVPAEQPPAAAAGAPAAERLAAFRALAGELVAVALAALKPATDECPNGNPTILPQGLDKERKGEEEEGQVGRPPHGPREDGAAAGAGRGHKPSHRVRAAAERVGGGSDAVSGTVAAARLLVACADPGYAYSMDLCSRWADPEYVFY